MNSQQVKNVAIIGVGLIGGSFGMALKKRGVAGNVIGIGRSPERLQKAVELGSIDSWTTDVVSGVKCADLVYIATPVGLELDFIRQISSVVKDGCIITDAGSTKSDICIGADEIGVCFVGGHPMAGSESAGVESADPDMFVDATYVLTPTANTNQATLGTVRQLAEAVGSRVVVMDHDAHDRCTAVISHLPHVIAAALVSLANDRSQQYPQLFDLIAGSFRDATRVASSSPVIWRDICLSNVEALRDATEGLKSMLDECSRILESGDAESLEAYFDAARTVRDSLYPEDKS